MKLSPKRKDAICVANVAIVVFLLAYVLLGYQKNGLSTPTAYTGGDDFTIYADTKAVIDNGWVWTSRNTGAPYGSEYAAFPSKNLMNFDFFIAKLISFFTKDVFTVVNVQFLLIFPMCAITAFLVLRSLNIKRYLALFGAFIFSLAPYIFGRGVVHFPLAQCYFVPLTIYLCIWASKGGSLCSDESDIKRKVRELLPIVVCCALTANNGTGYYQFFTCFFISVTALIMLGKERNLKAAKRSLFALTLVITFSAVSLIPYLVITISNGQAATVMRAVVDGELYGLKITQFFIPLNDHGNAWIAKLMEKYNGNMPLINENSTAYLGIGGIIGFLLSLVALLSKDEGNGENENKLPFLAKLILFAILYATVGGFSSLLSLTGFLFVRGFNRISIYILFMSICILCLTLQKGLDKAKKHGVETKIIALVCTCVFAGGCIWDVLPLYSDNRWAATLENNAKQSEVDRAFINEIERQLQDGDMVYQLPYHKYAEAGPVNSMPDYYHFIGTFYSDNLKWSFGGVRGLKSDIWNEFVSGFPIDKRIDILAASGFRGIYIDRRAYLEEDLEWLCNSIEEVLGCEPIISGNEALMFYNMYPYIEANPKVLEQKPLELSDIEGRTMFSGEQLLFTGPAEKTNASVLLQPQAYQYGPYMHLDAGYYRVTVYGGNLDVCQYDVACEQGTKVVSVNEVLHEEDQLIYEFVLTESIDNVEFRLFNNSSEDVAFSCLEVWKINE